MRFISVLIVVVVFAEVPFAQTAQKEFIVYFETSGLGSQTKQLLLDLEASGFANEAWTEREGTFVAITLDEPYLPLRQLLHKAKAIFDKHNIVFKPVQSTTVQESLRTNFRDRDKWYRASEMDSLSWQQVPGTWTSTITCPQCGHKKRERLPDDRCIMEYTCEKCQTVIKHKKGDCCVFCSYGDVKCPSAE